MKIYQVWAADGPFREPYNLGLYAASDEADAVKTARADNPEIASIVGVRFTAGRVMAP